MINQNLAFWKLHAQRFFRPIRSQKINHIKGRLNHILPQHICIPHILFPLITFISCARIPSAFPITFSEHTILFLMFQSLQYIYCPSVTISVMFLHPVRIAAENRPWIFENFLFFTCHFYFSVMNHRHFITEPINLISVVRNEENCAVI